MKKRPVLIGVLIACSWVMACADEVYVGGETANRQQSTSIQIAAELQIDSAQVFFLKRMPTFDSLIHREVIHGIGQIPVRFDFSLPAGNYRMYVFGNLPTDRLVMKPPYSQDSIGFSYQGGVEAPVVFYGSNNVDVGVDTLKLSGLILLVSEVVLTIKDIPTEIDRVEVSLLNTSSGVGLNGYFQERMSPPLSESLENVNHDSTYVLSKYCFPPTGNDKETSIKVLCYSNTGDLIYSGESSPFALKASYRFAASCSFDLQKRARMRGVGQQQLDNCILRWKYDEARL